jgi:tetratricopeptide (TPR) repeat protein
MKRGLARALRKLGNLAYNEKIFAAATALKAESIALFREVGTRWDLALDLRLLGQLLLEKQELDSAGVAFAESASLFQQENDPWGVGIAFLGLGSLELRSNDFEQANKHLKESMTALLRSPNLATISRSLALIGIAAAYKHEPRRAAQLFGAADRIREQEGVSLQILYQTMIEEGISMARQQLGEKNFANEWAKGRAMTMEQAVAYALEDSNRD